MRPEPAVTEPEVALPPANTWDAILANLRHRYPGQKDSVLFCIYRLQQNPQLSIRELKPEADLHQIPMAGRALHSAKLLLGLVKQEVHAAPVAAEEATRPRRTRTASSSKDDGASIEQTVLAAVRQIQTTASQETEQLRAAVRQAIAILQRALGG